jgi:hypothetical protein
MASAASAWVMPASFRISVRYSARTWSMRRWRASSTTTRSSVYELVHELIARASEELGLLAHSAPRFQVGLIRPSAAVIASLHHSCQRPDLSGCGKQVGVYGPTGSAV